MSTLLTSKCSVMEEISKTESSIKTCYDRLENLENKIQHDGISESKKDDIRRELSEVRKLLKTNEEQLSHLHKHNTKSFAIAAALFFVCFTVYALYVLVQGKDF